MTGKYSSLNELAGEQLIEMCVILLLLLSEIHYWQHYWMLFVHAIIRMCMFE